MQPFFSLSRRAFSLTKVSLQWNTFWNFNFPPIRSLLIAARTGTAATFLVYFLTFLPYPFIQPRYHSMSLSGKLLACLFPNLAMCLGCQLIGMFEGTGKISQNFQFSCWPSADRVVRIFRNWSALDKPGEWHICWRFLHNAPCVGHVLHRLCHIYDHCLVQGDCHARRIRLSTTMVFSCHSKLFCSFRLPFSFYSVTSLAGRSDAYIYNCQYISVTWNRIVSWLIYEYQKAMFLNFIPEHTFLTLTYLLLCSLKIKFFSSFRYSIIM